MVQLVPIGPLGELLWRDLPAPLSRLVAPPWCSSLCVVAGEVWQATPSPEEIWRTVALEPASALRHDALPGDPCSEDLPALAPQPRPLSGWLRAAINQTISGRELKSLDRMALLAGLLQVHDQLDASHECSQSIEGQGRDRHGDYWHAIMHRREPDYGNSKYWFRRVGDHPVYADLGRLVATLYRESPQAEVRRGIEQLTSYGWDPLAFVDLCQRVHQEPQSPLALAARGVQWAEMLLLLHRTWEDSGLPSVE